MFPKEFQLIVKEWNHKPNKILVDKNNEFYNKYMKSWLKDKNIEIFSMDHEGKSVVTEKFIRALKNKIYKYMTTI